MLNMMPAAILGTPNQRPRCLIPCLTRGKSALVHPLREKSGRRWEEMGSFHHQKGFLDFLSSPVPQALA